MMVLSKILLFDVYPVISEGHQLISRHVRSYFKTERWSLNAVGLTRGANAYTTIKLNAALGSLHMQNLLLFSFIHVWSCKAVDMAAVFRLWATTKAQAIERR